MLLFLNDPWHATATGGKSSHVKAMFALFKQTKQLSAIVEHYNTCCSIPVKNHMSLGIRVEMQQCPKTHPICRRCSRCNLLLDVGDDVRVVLEEWWTLCHRAAVMLSTQNRNHFHCLRPILRKTLLARRELTAALFGPQRGGATQWVAASQAVTAALHQSMDSEWAQGNRYGGPTPA
jgi:hypothetical protein